MNASQTRALTIANRQIVEIIRQLSECGYMPKPVGGDVATITTTHDLRCPARLGGRSKCWCEPAFTVHYRSVPRPNAKPAEPTVLEQVQAEQERFERVNGPTQASMTLEEDRLGYTPREVAKFLLDYRPDDWPPDGEVDFEGGDE